MARNISYETDHLFSSSIESDSLSVQSELAVVPKMLDELLTQRLNLPEGDFQARSALKLVISSTYGLFGSDFYSLYNPACANEITKIGQRACEVAKVALLESGITK